MGHSRGTYNRSSDVVKLAQACAREKKARKARARRSKALIPNRDSDTLVYWAFWSCVVLTVAWLCHACVYNL